MCYPADTELYPVPVGEAIRSPSTINMDSVRPYYNEIRYFLDCITSAKKPAVVTPEESLSSLEMLLAEIYSAKTGKSIRLI